MAVSLETDQLKSQKDPLHVNCMVLRGFTMLDYGSLTLNLFHLPRCRGMLGHAVFCLFLRACRKRWKNGRGKFLGFAKSISDCKTKYACATQTRQRETVQAYEPCSNIQHACEPTVVRLSCFGFYGLSFVSNDGPRKPLEFQKLPSGDLQIVYLTRHMAHQDVWCDTIEMHQSFNLCRIPDNDTDDTNANNMDNQ